MRTPAGSECRYYYEDFNRGRQTQECRLILRNRESLPWTPDLCARCRVPEILQANRSPELRLSLRLYKRLGLFKRLEVSASCGRHDLPLADPSRACERCAAEGEVRPG